MKKQFALTLNTLFSCFAVPNYITNDFKSSSTLFPSKSSVSQLNPQLHAPNIYMDKAAIGKQQIGHDRFNESKLIGNSNFKIDANFPNIMEETATVNGLKMEPMIKSEKSKSFSENGSKSECSESSVHIQRTDNNNSSINQMNAIAHQSSGCFPSTMDASAEQAISTDDLSYRNYSNPNDVSRPIVPFPNDIMANRALVANYEYSAVRSYENSMNGLSSAPTFDRFDMNLGNLYASSIQRPSLTYPSYLNTFAADDPNQQKYLHEHHFAQGTIPKNEPAAENATPYYPKPMYHYDPAFPLAGFSAMNLTLRSAAVAAASSTLPIMDLSPPNSMSNTHGHNSSHYSSVQRPQTSTSTSTSTSTAKSIRTPHASPLNNNNDQSSDKNRIPMSNSKMQSYQLQGDSYAHNSRSPLNEPVDLCNTQIKSHPGTFMADNAIGNAQNRPFSRESTSDSNASPYMDVRMEYKGEPMSEFFNVFKLKAFFKSVHLYRRNFEYFTFLSIYKVNDFISIVLLFQCSKKLDHTLVNYSENALSFTFHAKTQSTGKRSERLRALTMCIVNYLQNIYTSKNFHCCESRSVKNNSTLFIICLRFAYW